MRCFYGRAPLLLRHGVALATSKCFPTGATGRNYLQAFGTDLHASLGNLAPSFDAAKHHRLLVNQSVWCLVAESVFQGRVPIATEWLQRRTIIDFANHLAEDMLTKEDIVRMLNSL